jgi:hypothetical protein
VAAEYICGRCQAVSVAFGVIIYLITTNVAVSGYRFERSDGAAARNWASAEPIGARSARISLGLRGGTGV